MNPDNLQDASEEAVHKAKNAAQAIEFAREAQMAKMVEDTASRTKEALLSGLKEVFGDSDSENPQQMKVLVRRIPILCVNVEKMHGDISIVKEDVATINDNLKWGVRLILGAVVVAFIALLFK